MRTFYRFILTLVWPFAWILYPMHATGRRNIPEGAALVCANHSNFVDPILLAMAFGYRHMLFFMAKAELFSVPVLRGILKGLGTFGVRRGQQDILAIKTAMRHLKDGKKVMIFPEGTRVDADDAVDAKSGAIRLAARTGALIVPVHIPRGKKLFRPVTVSIGEAYAVSAESKDDLIGQAELLMDKIKRLKESAS